MFLVVLRAAHELFLRLVALAVEPGALGGEGRARRPAALRRVGGGEDEARELGAGVGEVLGPVARQLARDDDATLGVEARGGERKEPRLEGSREDGATLDVEA